MRWKAVIAMSALVMTTVSAPIGAAVTKSLDFETYPGGAPIPDGSVVHDSFATSHGVHFPDGVQVHDCSSSSACGHARSGTRVAMGRQSGEFNWRPIEIQFEPYLASKVSFSPSIAYLGKPVQGTVEATAYGVGGEVVDHASQTFTDDGSWGTRIELSTATDSIWRVVVTGADASASMTNPIAVDDLTFSSEGDTDAPVDSTAPSITVHAPSRGATVERTPVPVDLAVSDDTRVSRIDLRVVHAESGTVVLDYDRANVCGLSTSCASPTFRETVQLSLDPDRTGRYDYSFRACDGSGNCAEGTWDLVYDPVDPGPDDPVHVAAVEVNQAIQSWPATTVPTAGSTLSPEPYPAYVPIVPGKTTVVRLFPLSDGADRSGVTASMRLTVTNSDGTTLHRNLVPNDGQSSVTAPPAPADAELMELLLQMRTDADRTLDYVIPGDWLEDARSFTFGFEGVVETDDMRVDMARKTKLWMNVVYAFWGERGNAGLVAPETVTDTLLPTLDVMMPVGEVRTLSERWFDWGGPYIASGDCSSLLFDIWWAYGGYDAPVRPMTLDPVWVPTVGLYSSLRDCNGMAYRGSPNDWDDRIGETLISRPVGETLAHEIGHTVGLRHASNAHGEADGGSTRSWPYRHGAMAPPDGTDAHRGFGIVPEQTAVPAHPADAGQWQLTVLDVCPTSVLANRVPMCTLSDPRDPAVGDFGLQHELMSYGNGGRTPGNLSTGSNRWLSDENYKNILGSIDNVPTCTDVDRFYRHCGSSGHGVPSGAARTREASTASAEHTDALVDSLLVGGTMTAGGIDLFPLLRKDLPPGSVGGSTTGDHRIELRSADGTVLGTHDFDPHGAEGAFAEAIPWHEDASRLVVIGDGDVVADVAASSEVPTAAITRIEAVDAGGAIIEWDVQDGNGDDVYSYVQMSVDGGHTWHGLASRRPGGDLSSRFDLRGHEIDGAVLLRVIASDGFNVAQSPEERLLIAAGRSILDACPAMDVPEAGFEDVSADNVHAAAIDCARWWEVTAGTSPTTYGPRQGVTRAQMASFVARLIDSSGASLPQPADDRFDDDNGTVHEGNINRLAAAGIVTGKGQRRYAPNEIVTRAQMASFLVRAYEHRSGRDLAVSADYFDDDDNTTHEANVNKAAEAGFTAGTSDGTYAPQGQVRRDQMASFLMRTLDLLVQEGTAAPRS